MILCANPRAQYVAHQREIDAAILQTLDKGRYILGEQVNAFEREFAAHVGVGHGVGVGNGTDAIHVALRALGIGPGDEVITVAHTAVATVCAIELAGATPELVDIDPVTYTLNPALLRARITPRTKAIVAVHLYGHPADLDEIMMIAGERGIHVVEDCAQAHGATHRGRRVGSVGVVGCFSFYPTKNLGALGDGGMLVTSDPEIATRARQFREYGWVDRYVSSSVGMNTRLDELQAAVLRVKLPHLDRDNAARRDIARRYDEALASTGLTLPRRVGEIEHAFHLYVVRSPSRDRLLSDLQAKQIGALIHYPVPVHLQPAYRGRLPGSDTLPETEKAAREVLSLPMYPELAADDVARVIEELITWK
ncbi:MAG TPA: DegT/DnrJ/EryC1/StrS family aminotransferase [Kofleriaceae bacterium]|nr:DegT/DnrJ/EryC1/StrS family aminotransferase [Kofleriaceae bacterium]